MAAEDSRLQALLTQFLKHIEVYRSYSRHTVVAYRRDCTRFLESLQKQGCSSPENIEPHHVRCFAAELVGYAPATICRALDAISSWCRHLVAQGVLEANPAESLERPRRAQRIPDAATPHQIRALMRAAETPTEQLFMALLVHLGLRKSEIISLNVAHLSPDLTRVRVWGKGRKERELPLALPLRRLIADYLARRPHGLEPLLLNAVGRRMGATTLQRIFKRLLCRAGLKDSGLTIHSLRHHFATELIRQGTDVATLQHLLGHSELSSTAVYLHADHRTMRRAVERLAGRLEASGGATHGGSR